MVGYWPKTAALSLFTSFFHSDKIKARLWRWAEVCGDAREKRRDPATSDASDTWLVLAVLHLPNLAMPKKKEKIPPPSPQKGTAQYEFTTEQRSRRVGEAEVNR